MYVNKGKLPTSGISQPILQLVILNLSSDRRFLTDVTKTGNGERGTGNGSLGTSCQRKPP